MFISTLELFKIGIGPSSSHTMGPMLAALSFRKDLEKFLLKTSPDNKNLVVQCTLRGSLAYTGKGHHSDRGVIFGLHGYKPKELIKCDCEQLLARLSQAQNITVAGRNIVFRPNSDIIFDCGPSLEQHPNGMVFHLSASQDEDFQVLTPLTGETYFSIGGGFICKLQDFSQECMELPLRDVPFPFASAKTMLQMACAHQLTIAQMKQKNELRAMHKDRLNAELDDIWLAMKSCVENGLNAAEELLPGGLKVLRRAHRLHELCRDSEDSNINDWLCAYAIAVNEENAAGKMVVTAPTNGAAGVIPAVLYYCVIHRNIDQQQIRDFLLTAAAIGGIIKHCSSISGAEVGCQGEVGSASSMAAAGLCAVLGGNASHIENAAEIALEHHLGMTCDPVGGLVQIPCIERNGFGAIKAFTAAQLARRGSGQHFMPLDGCIAAMKQTGQEMSVKYKETSQGGLAVNLTEC